MGEYSIMPAQPLDQRIVERSLAKAEREDAQAFNFLEVVSVRTGGNSPFQLSTGNDPPDRILTDGSSRTWNLELTQLTFPEVRHELALARRFGRALNEIVESDSASYGHLAERQVMISLMPMDTLPRDTSELLSQLAEALTIDRGYFMQGVDTTQGLPEHLPNDGEYGTFGPFGVTVYGNRNPQFPKVVSSAQAEQHPKTALRTFRETIASKDRVENEVVLVSLAAPDSLGYICPPDFVLYRFLKEAHDQGKLLDNDPVHIAHIAVHLWNTPEWFGVSVVRGPAPWRPS